VLNRDARRAAQTICQTISFQLIVFPKSVVRKVAMKKVLQDPIFVFNALKHFKFSKQGVVEQELFLGPI